MTLPQAELIRYRAMDRALRQAGMSPDKLVHHELFRQALHCHIHEDLTVEGVVRVARNLNLFNDGRYSLSQPAALEA